MALISFPTSWGAVKEKRQEIQDFFEPYKYGIGAGTIIQLINRKGDSEREARERFLNAQLDNALASGSSSTTDAAGNVYRFNPASGINELVGRQTPNTIAAQLEAAGYRPGTPDYTAAMNADLEAIAAQRQALAGLSVPSVNQARTTSPELEFYKRGIAERQRQSAAALDAGFGTVVGDINARRAAIDPAAARAAAAAAFANAAAATAANNAIADQGLSTGAGQDVVGVGPITGDAADAPAYLTAAGATAGDTAAKLAQLSAEDLAWLANTTSGVAAARKGELDQQRSAFEADAVRQFLADEQARVERERAAQQAALARREEAIINLAGREASTRAEYLRRQADAKSDADNRWLGTTMGYEADRLVNTPAKPPFDANEISYDLFSAARGGKDAFVATVGQMRAVYGRELDGWLRSQGYPLDADGAWKELNRRARAGK